MSDAEDAEARAAAARIAADVFAAKLTNPNAWRAIREATKASPVLSDDREMFQRWAWAELKRLRRVFRNQESQDDPDNPACAVGHN